MNINGVNLRNKSLKFTSGGKDIRVDAIPSKALSLVIIPDEYLTQLKNDDITKLASSTNTNTTNWNLHASVSNDYKIIGEIHNPIRYSRSTVLFDNVCKEFIIIPSLKLLNYIPTTTKVSLNSCYTISNYKRMNDETTVSKSFDVTNSDLIEFPELKGNINFETYALYLNGIFNIPDDNAVEPQFGNISIKRAITKCVIFHKLGKIDDIFLDADDKIFTVKTLAQTHPDLFGVFDNIRCRGKELKGYNLYITLC